MVDSADFHNNFHTATRAGAQVRAKTAQPFQSQPPPVRANQSSKIDRQVPRSFDLVLRYPPPPSVEDEAQSLAKEHGSSVLSVSSPSSDEEPKHRGSLDQYPILELVDEPAEPPNLERRFVYVGSKEPSDDDADFQRAESRKPQSAKEEYKANTVRKLATPSRPVEKPSEKSTEQPANKLGDELGEEVSKVRRRPSGLPRIETNAFTNGRLEEPSRTSSRNPSRISSRDRSRDRSRTDSRNRSRTRSRTRSRNRSGHRSPKAHRSKPSAHIQQQPRDYFDHQESPGYPGDGFLSPTPAIIKHSTKGRDRAYVDFNPSGSGNDLRRRSTIVNRSARPALDDRRSDFGYGTPTRPSETPTHRRSTSAIDLSNPSRRESDRRSELRYYPNETSSPRGSRTALSPPRSLDRRSSSPSRRNSQMKPLPAGSQGYERYPSEDYSRTSRQFPRDARDSRTSFVEQNDSNYLLSPQSARPSRSGRAGSSRRESPLPSPRESATRLDASPLPSPRSSTTFPYSSDRRYGYGEGMSEFPVSPGASSPPKSPLKGNLSFTARESESQVRARSRANSSVPSLNTSFTAPVTAAAGTGAAAATYLSMSQKLDIDSNPIERRRTPAPPPAAPARQDSVGSNGSLKLSSCWKPRPLVLEGPDGYATFQDVRCSLDIMDGSIPELPACPRRDPQAGFFDWLTFPHYSSCNICPECYDKAFAPTEFAHSLVPAPFRPMDRPIACDFGNSFWFRFAWLMTRHSRLPNLQLLQNVAAVAAKHQQCPGDQIAKRVWSTVRDPADGRLVDGFSACSYCAAVVQTVFPNLAGTFQLADAKAEPTQSVCSLHFGPGNIFTDYFTALEEASMRALERGSAPDVGRLCGRLRQVGARDAQTLFKLELIAGGECPRDRVLKRHRWHTMRTLRGFTVCEACFQGEVVGEIGGKNPIALDFLKDTVQVDRASCQLYSPRMRQLFFNACRDVDFEYLADAVYRRLELESEIKHRLAKYRAANKDGRYQDKIERLESKWLEVE